MEEKQAVHYSLNIVDGVPIFIGNKTMYYSTRWGITRERWDALTNKIIDYVKSLKEINDDNFDDVSDVILMLAFNEAKSLGEIQGFQFQAGRWIGRLESALAFRNNGGKE